MSTNCLARDFTFDRITGDQPEDVEEQVTDVTAKFLPSYLIFDYIVWFPGAIFVIFILHLNFFYVLLGVHIFFHFLHVCVCLYACLPASLPTCLPAALLPAYIPTYLSVCLSVCLPACPPARLPAYLSLQKSSMYLHHCTYSFTLLQIRMMCYEYISNPNAIILAVTAANQDLGARFL